MVNTIKYMQLFESEPLIKAAFSDSPDSSGNPLQAENKFFLVMAELPREAPALSQKTV
ncbi:MAG: tRNA U34 5-methylaminomethyl-2-thiouridine-forming methyltransferase MnmC [Flavobacterium sp.]|jgi:tRNA U34 5-methylaminomethyl-2-thiouridine-forming methyltransferase MnmC